MVEQHVRCALPGVSLRVAAGKNARNVTLVKAALREHPAGTTATAAQGRMLTVQHVRAAPGATRECATPVQLAEQVMWAQQAQTNAVS